MPWYFQVVKNKFHNGAGEMVAVRAFALVEDSQFSGVVSPVPEDTTPSPDLCGHSYIYDTQTHMNKNQVNLIKSIRTSLTKN